MKPLQLRIDRAGTVFEIEIPASVLCDSPILPISLPEGNRISMERFTTIVGDSFLAGWGIGKRGANLEDSISELYEKMLGSLEDRHLYRVWHFIPKINEWQSGLENYRRFCRARAEAFSNFFGENWHEKLPAASAVGTDQSEPVVLFLAGRNGSVSVENPEQTPAFRYPLKYGPQPPGFVRACKTTWNERPIFFLSGTASIKGSETIHAGNCLRQTETTLENLALVSQEAGLGSDLGKSLGGTRTLIIYLRHKEDFPKVKALLDERFFLPNDRRIYLRADICRSDLLVEIEATIELPAEK